MMQTQSWSLKIKDFELRIWNRNTIEEIQGKNMKLKQKTINIRSVEVYPLWTISKLHLLIDELTTM